MDKLFQRISELERQASIQSVQINALETALGVLLKSYTDMNRGFFPVDEMKKLADEARNLAASRGESHGQLEAIALAIEDLADRYGRKPSFVR